MNKSVIENILQKEVPDKIRDASVHSIFYYGSGCSTEKNCEIVGSSLRAHFPNAEIEVQHDLLAAARALLGRSEGIACILGTGANSCSYDGKAITKNVASLGYMFGDEGSGAYIGRKFLSLYLKGSLPKEINDAFMNKYKYSLEDILGKVYGAENPSTFMASFTRFMAEHEHEDKIKDILLSSFNDFFTESIAKYERYKQITVSFVGSVAYHFRHILSEAAWQQGISIGRIEQGPLEGLIRFHKDIN
jgi:N-acetylglucosamine kinase-like BadF-type ATPase